MSLSEMEQHVFAYFVANGAQDFSMVGRYFPYGELTLVIQDKIQVATRKFGGKASRASPNAARAFLDVLIEREAFSTKQNDYGGTMHQYQPKPYQDVIKDLQETNPIIRQAQAAGTDFWPNKFAELSGN